MTILGFLGFSVLLQLACMSDVSVPVAAMIAALAVSELLMVSSPEEKEKGWQLQGDGSSFCCRPAGPPTSSSDVIYGL